MPVDHYRFVGAQQGTEPKLLFQVKVDIVDIRSGYSSTERQVLVADYLDDPELTWTADMVRSITLDQVEEIQHPAAQWPERADELVVDYLSRRRGPTIWHHQPLKLYSDAGETRGDFVDRCRDALAGERNRKMGRFKELFFHRLGHLERRVTDALDGQDWIQESQRLPVLSDVRNVFSEARDKASRLFMADTYQIADAIDWTGSAPGHLELEEQLNDLWSELERGFNRIGQEFESVANEVDSYEVSLSGLAVEIFSRGFVWS